MDVLVLAHTNRFVYLIPDFSCFLPTKHSFQQTARLVFISFLHRIDSIKSGSEQLVKSVESENEYQTSKYSVERPKQPPNVSQVG